MRLALKGARGIVLFSVCAALAADNAWGQGGPVQQGGKITPGHIAQWNTNGVIGDGGGAAEGNAKEIGITNSGTPFCINDGPITGPYHQLCFGANSLGGGLVSFQAYNGAPVTSLMCNINGVQTPCELSASNVQNLPGPLTVAGTGTFGGAVKIAGTPSPRLVLLDTNTNTADGLWFDGTSGTLNVSSIDPATNGALKDFAQWDRNGNLFNPGNITTLGTITAANINAPSLTTTGGISAPGITVGANGIESAGPVEFPSATITHDMVLGGNLTAASGEITALQITAGADGLVSNGPFDVNGDAAISGNLGINKGLTATTIAALGGGITSTGVAVLSGGLDVSGVVPGGAPYALYVNGPGTVQTGFDIAGTIPGVPGWTLVVNGNALATSFQVSSDAKLKSDVKDFKPQAVEAIKKLRPVSYHFDGKPGRHVGLIADEVAKVVPEAVSEARGTKTLDPMALIDVLILANRELAARVETLEKQAKAK